MRFAFCFNVRRLCQKTFAWAQVALTLVRSHFFGEQQQQQQPHRHHHRRANGTIAFIHVHESLSTVHFIGGVVKMLNWTRKRKICQHHSFAADSFRCHHFSFSHESWGGYNDTARAAPRTHKTTISRLMFIAKLASCYIEKLGRELLLFFCSLSLSSFFVRLSTEFKRPKFDSVPWQREKESENSHSPGLLREIERMFEILLALNMVFSFSLCVFFQECTDCARVARVWVEPYTVYERGVVRRGEKKSKCIKWMLCNWYFHCFLSEILNRYKHKT